MYFKRSHILSCLTVGSIAVASSFVVTDVGAAEMSRELIEAVRTDDLNQVERLIMSGVEVSGKRGDGSTALHWAVHRENIEISDLLIDSGADINAADDHGVTPLALACLNGSSVMVEQLLRGKVTWED